MAFEGESLGMPTDIAAQAGQWRPKRGLMAALFGTMAPEATAAETPAAPQPIHRFEDEKGAPRYGGAPQADDLEQGATAQRASLGQAMRTVNQTDAPAQPAPQPQTLKQMLFPDGVAKGLVRGGLLALAGPKARSEYQQRQEFEEGQNLKQRMMQQQEQLATQRMQEQERLGTERMTLQEKLEADREKAQSAREAVGKTVTLGDQVKQWNPATQTYDIPLGTAKPQKPDTPEQQLIDQETSQGKSLPQAIQDYARLTQKPERSGAADARGQRSYQFQSSRIDKLATPIEQRAERISRLEDTLAQGNPQSDALVAPELLTIMAGGQGSGLRMNEAEIARIVGGRSAWENLKANIQHWSVDPNAARSITPDQQRQIRGLFAAVKDRVNQKMQILDQERGALSNADDPMEHRKIYDRLQRRLSAIDTTVTGGTEQGDSLKAKSANQAPEGTRIQVGNQIQVKRAGKWVPE